MMFAEREIRIVFAELSVVAQSNAICACADGEASERETEMIAMMKAGNLWDFYTFLSIVAIRQVGS